jgi:hypothetical protein
MDKACSMYDANEQLILWSRVLEKLIVAQIFNEFPSFMEPEF